MNLRKFYEQKDKILSTGKKRKVNEQIAFLNFTSKNFSHKGENFFFIVHLLWRKIFLSTRFFIHIKSLILQKNPNFRPALPLFLTPLKNRKSARLQTNKEYFSSLSLPKVSYHYACSWMVIWKKITFLNLGKNQFLVFPLNLHFLGM